APQRQVGTPRQRPEEVELRPREENRPQQLVAVVLRPPAATLPLLPVAVARQPLEEVRLLQPEAAALQPPVEARPQRQAAAVLRRLKVGHQQLLAVAALPLTSPTILLDGPLRLSRKKPRYHLDLVRSR
ncbi:hypothetical protein, partial [Phaeobacter sp. SYSU ZJ3003]|uniref:hypothetical protein n=1 Tax=Phaeobacter sp. SYSU ZJ3003 TaxID=2109330 RepID=UPI00351CA33E